MKKHFPQVIIIFLCLFVLFPLKTSADELLPDGYFWEKLTPNEKFVYVFAYIEGISEMNLEWRHQMDVLMYLYDMKKNEENKYLAEYGRETKVFYEKHYHYFGIPYRQLIEGVDNIYKEYKNKTIRLKDALSLVKSDIEGTDKKELEQRMIFMRKSEKEQKRISQELLDFLNSIKEPPKKENK